LCKFEAWPDRFDSPLPRGKTIFTGKARKKKALKRVNTLIEAAVRTPFAGIGKPEPLMGDLSGYWARRIDEVHRLVYAVDEADLDVIACRGHYDD